MGFWNWIKASAEGNNQTASSRRLTAFQYVVLSSLQLAALNVLIYLMILRLEVITNQQIDLVWVGVWLYSITNLMVLLPLGLISIQQIIELKNSFTTKTVTKEKATDTTIETTKVQETKNDSNI